jgi:hypothetical protein
MAKRYNRKRNSGSGKSASKKWIIAVFSGLALLGLWIIFKPEEHPGKFSHPMLESTVKQRAEEIFKKSPNAEVLQDTNESESKKKSLK